MSKRYTMLSTDWGFMAVVSSESGLWKLSFPRPDEAQAMADCVGQGGAEYEWETQCSEDLNSLVEQLKLYWRGFPVDFSVMIDWTGYTPFQTAVLKYTASIPYGQTQTYRQVAEAIGAPKAARAAGGALHINRVPIVVPCHRVVGSNGSLTGFGGGLEMKKALLLLEGKVNEEILVKP